MGIHGLGMGEGRRDLIVSGPDVGFWVARRINGTYNPESSQAIGLVRDQLVAGVIYENWNHRSITCHIAIEGRLSKRYIAAIFDYPFNVAMVEKIICPVASSNEASKKLVENMGFRKEAKITDAHPEGDILIYTMTRQKCRFLGVKYGQKLKSSPGP